MIDRKAYDFFRAHAGYVVGRSAEGALALARAEALFERAEDDGVAEISWADDDEPYDPGDAETAEEAHAKFESNEWTGPFGCVLKINGEVAGSLWGIVVGPRGTDDPYCRVVAAELALGALDDLRQALLDEGETHPLLVA